VLAAIDEMNADGLEVRAQVATRGIGILLGLQATLNPFSRCPSYREVAGLPLPERVSALRDGNRRHAIVTEWSDHQLRFEGGFHRMFALGDPPDYEPAPDASVAALAARDGRDAVELAYDLLLADDGRALLYSPIINYPDGLRLQPPRLAFDLPAGGRRLLQGADGYRHTFVAGQEVYADGEGTGALPGRLVRGAQPAPAGGPR
jgi:N-acyl-D-aspartate/D-glutamate deacylase